MPTKFIKFGFLFLTAGIISLEDLLILVVCKLFNINVQEYDIHLCLIIGSLLIIVGVILYYFEEKKSRVLTIIGLDNISFTKKITNPITINIINDCKKIKKSNSNRIISNYIKEINGKITNYFAYSFSYFGIAPLPFIAIAGKYYRKIKMNHHYEYYQKNDSISALKKNRHYTS